MKRVLQIHDSGEPLGEKKKVENRVKERIKPRKNNIYGSSHISVSTVRYR